MTDMSTVFFPRSIRLGLSSRDRRAVEQQIEALIDLLDELDGDPDLEAEHDDHDDCEWGEPLNYAHVLPVYGIDQSVGPLNIHEIH